MEAKIMRAKPHREKIMAKDLDKYSILLYTALLLLALLWERPAQAQIAVDISGQDCGAILESYAANPKSVPKDVADACQQALLVAPAAGAAKAQGGDAELIDPCAGPNANGSVYCWGPWPTLQPAAGPSPQTAQASAVVCNGPECLVEPTVESGDPDTPFPDLPVGGCAAGQPCGFATVVEGLANAGDPTLSVLAVLKSQRTVPASKSIAISTAALTLFRLKT